MKQHEDKNGLLEEDETVEDIEDDELQELVLAAQEEALARKASGEEPEIQKRRVPKWLALLMAATLFFSTFAVVFEIYSIPAIDFLKTSAKLSALENIATYKKAVVNIQTGNSKGTGFSISEDGTILTNYHVIEGHDKVTVTFPEEGRFTADVVQTFPSVDLAVINVDDQNLPSLELAVEPTFEVDEPIYFIGNPLSFTGIANEGTIIGYKTLRDWDVPVVMMKAPVYRGNSGSPVLNQDGQVIGVVFATLNEKTHGKVGLFVPIDEYFAHK